MTAGITLQVRATRSTGTAQFDKHYVSHVAPVFTVVWEDVEHEVHLDTVSTTEDMCPAKFLRERGVDPDDAIIERIGMQRS